MKTANSKTASRQLAGEVALARLRLAKAESQLKSAKQQARLARRRRKEAKQAARHAKKQAKLAKREVAEASKALADAEAKLFRSRRRTIRTKAGKTAAPKAAAAPNRRKAARPAAVPLRKAGKKKRLRSTPAKPPANPRPKVREAAQPIAVPRDLEVPTAAASALGGPATGQSEKTSGESYTGEAAAGTPVETGRS